MSKVAVIGSGTVGQVLAEGFIKHGHEVMRASRDPSKLAAWKAATGANASVGTFGEAASWGEIVVLCVKGTAAEEAVALCGAGLDGKPVIDATNPLANAPPVNGVLSFFTGPNDSLMERLQKRAPQAHFVKAFSSVGSPVMVNPSFEEGRPSMFICGNDADAKARVTALLDAFGWETEDMGHVEAARVIEPLCILWCITGFTKNQWGHAYKVLKPKAS